MSYFLGMEVKQDHDGSNAMNKNTLPDTKFFFTGKICFSFAVINFCPVLVPYINIFQFVEGAFVTALRNGDWILLDEVNLAPPEERYLHKYLFDEYLMARGNTSSGDFLENYILIRNLARAVLIKRYPVLLQGPTSSGKTSLVQYLAAITSHEFVWINNHEHTDVQEYLGSYVTDASGKLVFHEGVLVKGVWNGYLIVLDKLNLASSDMLEALNQLLDDNRELFVPELRETMPAQLDFMPFSTLNPPTLYGGHKMLSRAFRNRFVESHVDEIPEDELSTILNNWCKISESYVKIMVEVMKELKLHRQSSEVFAGKHGFITLIDLFWWADHFRTFGNSNEDLARDGYYLLAETFKDEGEKKVVQAVLAKHLQVKLLKDNLYHQKWQTLFMWQDGPLVQAMKDGDMFLVDEISLADDSVLEQLNNVLEPERKLAGPAAFFPIHYHYSCYRYHYL
uniref:Midasin n=1 Tax=Vitis vinifera TaxID=29760 RepID=F6H5X0_VITVI